ncbi:MAG: GntR family transcriptional regulator [Solibacillus sp.]|uniref:GntR family transcriptional regulator n=1 Tax=unclassified Solibacillus TaxID=2637870 RepID=UPI0030F4D8AF
MKNLKTNLSKQVEQILRSRIMLLELKEGEHLKENNLAIEFNISRGPIREAIIKLEQEGLVATSSNGRTLVSKFDIRYIKNLYDVRILLEKYAIQSLDEELVACDKEEMNELIRQMIENVGDNELYHEADLNFHFQIVKMTKNITLINSWLGMKELFSTLIQVTTKASTERSQEIMQEHQQIYDAISNKQFEKASKYLEDHLKSAADYYCEAVFRLQNMEV